MNETLQEYVDSHGVRMRVDRTLGIIRGVKILGLRSRNGRIYRPAALVAAAQLYEDAKVNVNHSQTNTSRPRDYQDRLGTIRNVVAHPHEGLFADLHFNPKHALAEQLMWDAEHAPENVGFSHNVLAKTSRAGDEVTVEAITKVQSVDLVADPATTQGLFESIDNENTVNTPNDVTEPIEMPSLAEATVDDLRQYRPDLVEALLKNQAAELAKLRAELEQLRTVESIRQKRFTACRLLQECGLPQPESNSNWDRLLVDDSFFESLMSAPDEPSMRKLVQRRAALIREANRDDSFPLHSPIKPLSRDQIRIEGMESLTKKTFVEAIT